jgi:GT2 family glycosyltransferase
MTHKIHVLLTVYHRAAELERCFESLVQSAPYVENNQFFRIQKVNCWVNGTDTSTDAVLHRWRWFITTEGFNKNVGKAVGMNTLFQLRYQELKDDYICIADPDLIFRTDALKNMYELLRKAATPSIVLPEHDGFRSHLPIEQMSGAIQYNVWNGCSGDFVVSHTGYGMAGGGMLLTASLFRKLGCFDVNSLYGGNEAGLWHKFVHSYGKRATIVINEGARVEHIPDTDEEYTKWKCQCQRQIRTSGYSDMEEYKGFANQGE